MLVIFWLKFIYNNGQHCSWANWTWLDSKTNTVYCIRYLHLRWHRTHYRITTWYSRKNKMAIQDIFFLISTSLLIYSLWLQQVKITFITKTLYNKRGLVGQSLTQSRIFATNGKDHHFFHEFAWNFELW